MNRIANDKKIRWEEIFIMRHQLRTDRVTFASLACFFT